MAKVYDDIAGHASMHAQVLLPTGLFILFV